MIYTITFNPAIDLVMNVPKPTLGELNRAREENYVVGGKGINVSTMLKNFQMKSIATGFVAGFTGDYILNQVENAYVTAAFVEVSGVSRINVKLQGAQETEINGTGPKIAENDFNQLLHFLEKSINLDDVVFLMGNVAEGLDSTHYERVSHLVQQKEGRLILDTTKDLLSQCLKYEPFVIKPNIHELEELFDQKLGSQAEIIEAARTLQAQGAQNILVSMGGDGALLITADQIFFAQSPIGQVINSVGAGDSLLAGFTANYLKTNEYADSLRMAIAAGSATAFSIGIAEFSQIEELYEKIVVQTIN